MDDIRFYDQTFEETLAEARRLIETDAFWTAQTRTERKRRVRFGLGHFHLKDGVSPDGTPVHIYLYLTTDPTDSPEPKDQRW